VSQVQLKFENRGSRNISATSAASRDSSLHSARNPSRTPVGGKGGFVPAGRGHFFRARARSQRASTRWRCASLRCVFVVGRRGSARERAPSLPRRGEPLSLGAPVPRTGHHLVVDEDGSPGPYRRKRIFGGQANHRCSHWCQRRHDLDVWRLGANGVVLLGHLRGVEDGTCIFAADLEQTLNRADEAFNDVLRSVDDYIEWTGLRAPEPGVSSTRFAVPTPIKTLDLRAAGIRSVVWATGFRDDFDWVHVPVFDYVGQPVHRRGVTRQLGLHFLGLSWLHKHKSASLIGAGEDAAYLAEHIATRL
jgi:hypothetical protein